MDKTDQCLASISLLVFIETQMCIDVQSNDKYIKLNETPWK